MLTSRPKGLIKLNGYCCNKGFAVGRNMASNTFPCRQIQPSTWGVDRVGGLLGMASLASKLAVNTLQGKIQRMHKPIHIFKG